VTSQHDLLDGVPQRHIAACPFLDRGMLVMSGPTGAGQLAPSPDRKPWFSGLQLDNHRMPLRERTVLSPLDASVLLSQVDTLRGS